MATCKNQTPYEMVPLVDLADLKDHVVRVAKIIDIDRFTGLAEVEYLEPCQVTMPTEGVAFYYHCEWSTGSVLDLAEGHLAFMPDDEVYIIMLPDVPAAPGATGRTYIIGHADMRATQPCGTEWTCVRVTQFSGCGAAAFIIIDLVTGKLYDKWPEVTWPVWSHRSPELPINANLFGRENYMRFLLRKYLVDIPVEEPWRYIKWSTYDQEYSAETRIEGWEIEAYNQFRQGFSWRPGAIFRDMTGYTTDYSTTGPTSSGGGGTVASKVNGDNQCWTYIDTLEGRTDAGGVSDYWGITYYAKLDPYYFVNLPYQDVHELQTLSGDCPGEQIGRWHTADNLTNVFNKALYNGAEGKYYNFSEYDKEQSWMAEAVNSYTRMPTYFNMLEYQADAPLCICQGDEIVYHLSYPGRWDVLREKIWTSNKDGHYWHCHAEGQTWEVVDTDSENFTFSISAPWKADFYSDTIRGKRVMTTHYSSAGNHGSIEFFGHPGLCNHYGDKSRLPPNGYTDPLMVKSTCIMNGRYGIWGLTVCAHWNDSFSKEDATFHYNLDDVYDYRNLSRLVIDTDKFIVKATMGFARITHFNDVADVRLSDLREITVPANLIAMIQQMCTADFLDANWMGPYLPEEYGGTAPDPPVMDADAIAEFMCRRYELDMFSVIIADPPPS